MSIVNTTGSATMGATEFYCASNSTTQTPQTTSQVLQWFVDVTNMAAGDQFQFTIYEKVNGGTEGICYQSVLTGAQQKPIQAFPALVLVEGWECSIKKLAGTDRAMNFALRKIS